MARTEAGEEIVVRRGAQAGGEDRGVSRPHDAAPPGALKGQIVIADDFDATPDEFAEYTA